ncbi:MAG: PorT family protein [Flavobacteriales bacterium]|nr:PorT family protein [Flavobacteriales bacterium]
MKIKFATILFIVAVGFSYSQLRFGVKGGVQRTALKDINNPSEKRDSFHAGIFGLYNLSSDDQFYIQLEALYFNHGEKSPPYKSYLTYIAVPVLFKTYFSEAESEFFLEVGPQFAYEIGKDNTLPKDRQYIYGEGDVTKTEKLDISAAIGFGYSYQRNWELGVRYNHGFTDLFPDYESAVKKKNIGSALSLYLNYIFD